VKTLPPVDVVIIGGGWTGLLMAKEIGSRTGLSIVVLERGEPRDTAYYSATMDELDYLVRNRMMQNCAKDTVTFRHNQSQRALPLRQLGSFLPGTGVGGSGEHWGAGCPRHSPDCFDLYTKTVEKYGVKKLPEDCTIQDWGITYDELEPYYTRAEKLIGVAGKASNIKGKVSEGGNIFEGWRSGEYPLPPTKQAYYAVLFNDAAKSLGYHPYAYPSATLTQLYTNPDGVTRPACTYCGYCHAGCMIAAKAQPTNVLLPVIQKNKRVTIRTRTRVRRIVHDGLEAKGRARGVTYMDHEGDEIHQPADLVLLCSWTFSNTRLLLLSGIGKPYDPATGEGTLGRNLTHELTLSAARVFMDQPLNRFMGTGASGINIDDLSCDHIDHTNLPFIRGGLLRAATQGYQPILNFGHVPPSVKTRWGAEWKKTAVNYYDRTAPITFIGEHLAYKSNFMDLDSTYKDEYGDPLLRLTLDWRENERKMTEFMVPKAIEMARAMGAKEITPFGTLGHYDATRYQGTQVHGGTIMGSSPATSVVNPYLQHWQVSNLFVLGGSVFPQKPVAGPTLTILSQTLRTADAIVDRYLKSPGTLA
jgi:gluconate 2-dehydrogenase alpha chain